MAQAAAEKEGLFQFTGIGVVETDVETGRFLRTVGAFCEMVGYTKADLLTMTNAELTHPEDWDRDSERFTALKRGAIREDNAVTRVLHKDRTVTSCGSSSPSP